MLECPRRDVPRDVTRGQRCDDRLLEGAVLPAVLPQLVLVLGGDVDLESAVAVEIGEADGVLESRRPGVDQRLLPAGTVLLEQPEAARHRAPDEIDLAIP